MVASLDTLEQQCCLKWKYGWGRRSERQTHLRCNGLPGGETIGEMYRFECEVDAILITGGIAYDKYFVNLIQERTYKMAPFTSTGWRRNAGIGYERIDVIMGELEPKSTLK